MAFFQRITGQYVMHRVYKIKPEGYYFLGDAQRIPEGPTHETQIWVIVKKSKKKTNGSIPIVLYGIFILIFGSVLYH